MASPRSNNLERAKWRSKCRRKLSEHIKNNLGISIDPAQVRLITSTDDPYTWKALPGKEHLFKKQLNRKSQESVETKFSFTTAIEDLQADNVELADRLNQWKDQVAKESNLKELAEEEVNRLKIRMQAAEMHNQQLQQEVQRLVLVADHFRSITIRSSEEVNGVLEKLKFELCSSSGGQDMGWVFSQSTFCSN